MGKSLKGKVPLSPSWARNCLNSRNFCHLFFFCPADIARIPAKWSCLWHPARVQGQGATFLSPQGVAPIPTGSRVNWVQQSGQGEMDRLGWISIAIFSINWPIRTMQLIQDLNKFSLPQIWDSSHITGQCSAKFFLFLGNKLCISLIKLCVWSFKQKGRAKLFFF